MEIITSCNLKGGTGKSTSTAFLAHAYAAKGLKVLVVDADPQASVTDWASEAEWEIPTVGLAVKTLHTRLHGIIPPGTDIVLIDTPPLEDKAGIVYSALRVATKVLITMAPTMMDYGRLGAVWDAIEAVDPLRNEPVQAAVLMIRTMSGDGVGAVQMYRQQIRDDGHQVLDIGVRQHQVIAQAFAAPIIDLREYDKIAEELTTLGESA